MKKPDSNQLSLVTVFILGQPPNAFSPNMMTPSDIGNNVVALQSFRQSVG